MFWALVGPDPESGSFNPARTAAKQAPCWHFRQERGLGWCPSSPPPNGPPTLGSISGRRQPGNRWALTGQALALLDVSALCLSGPGQQGLWWPCHGPSTPEVTSACEVDAAPPLSLRPCSPRPEVLSNPGGLGVGESGEVRLRLGLGSHCQHSSWEGLRLHSGDGLSGTCLSPHSENLASAQWPPSLQYQGNAKTTGVPVPADALGPQSSGGRWPQAPLLAQNHVLVNFNFHTVEKHNISHVGVGCTAKRTDLPGAGAGASRRRCHSRGLRPGSPAPQVPTSSAHHSGSPPGAAFQGVLAHGAPAGFSPAGQGSAPPATGLCWAARTPLWCLLQARPAEPGRLGSRVPRPDRYEVQTQEGRGEGGFPGLQRHLSKNRTRTLSRELGGWLLGAFVRGGLPAAPTGTVVRELALPEAEFGPLAEPRLWLCPWGGREEAPGSAEDRLRSLVLAPPRHWLRTEPRGWHLTLATGPGAWRRGGSPGFTGPPRARC